MTTQLQIPFIFWNKNSPDLRHTITCACLARPVIVTGSETGELCIWNDFTPSVLCVVPNEEECRALALIRTPSKSLLSSASWVISIHSDNTIRGWDIQDGRCMAVSSGPLLPEATCFDKLSVIQDRILAVAGEVPEIYLIDGWSMERVGFFSLKNSGILKCGMRGKAKFFAIDFEGNIAF